MAANLPQINLGNIFKNRNLGNIPVIELIGKHKTDKRWEEIAVEDTEVRALLAAGFRHYDNSADPDNPSRFEDPVKVRDHFNEVLKKLTAEFGPGGFCVIKSAYDMSGRPYKGGVAFWVCDVKPEFVREVEKVEEAVIKPAERPPLLF